MCRRCGGHGCGQCNGGNGLLKRDCALYPGPGMDPRGISCKYCFTKPKNCSGQPYGCPNVNYYPCGFGGKSYGCRGKEPWEIKHLNHVWNYKPCCNNYGGGGCGGGGGANSAAPEQSNVPTIHFTMLPPGCPPPHPLFPRLQNDTTAANGDLDLSSDKKQEGMTSDPKNGNPDPCIAMMNNNNMWEDPCGPESEAEDEEECEEEPPVTAADVSKYMDKIQTFIMTDVRGDDKHTVQCIKDLVSLRINVLGTASSIVDENRPVSQYRDSVRSRKISQGEGAQSKPVEPNPNPKKSVPGATGLEQLSMIDSLGGTHFEDEEDEDARAVAKAAAADREYKLSKLS